MRSIDWNSVNNANVGGDKYCLLILNSPSYKITLLFSTTMRIFKWPYAEKCAKLKVPKKKRSSLTIKSRPLHQKHHQVKSFSRRKLSDSCCEDSDGYQFNERHHHSLHHHQHRHHHHRHHNHTRQHRHHNHSRSRSSGNVIDPGGTYQPLAGSVGQRHLNRTNASLYKLQDQQFVVDDIVRQHQQMQQQQHLPQQQIFWMRRPSLQDMHASLDRNQHQTSSSWNYVRNVDDILQLNDASNIAILKGAQAHRRRRKVNS